MQGLARAAWSGTRLRGACAAAILLCAAALPAFRPGRTAGLDRLFSRERATAPAPNSSPHSNLEPAR